MADPLVIATRRQIAEKRLRAAAEAVSSRFGVALRKPTCSAHRFPDVYAAEQLENIVALFEELAALPQTNRKERVSA